MSQSVNDIRAAFLEFFKRNGHEVRPSSSLVPHNDPTLMFANAGMNQFKNVFTGAEKLPFARATTSQKCVRAGGKHNDLDNVGYTARHHTFFEMLGNFSFGDYFKEEAIFYAWEFFTKHMHISPEKLSVTIYHTDDEAFNYWKKISGMPDHKIIRIATNDNFWMMGDTGPCGPCSEIFYDHGEHIPGGPPGSPDEDGDRFIEIWNLVFMQYEQVDANTRINLPKPSIDTGMSIERLAAIVQGVHSNYEIDLFKNIFRSIEELTHTKTEGENLSAHRVLADHLRSSCFLIADGVLPSNEGRGYVLRRIMRRAMRYAHQMGCKDPLMYRLVPALVAEMGGAYPELKRAEASITDNLKQEEERFKETLGRGLSLLEEEITKMSPYSLSFRTRDEGIGTFPGEIAFKLYDTYGFPLDLTQDILRARGWQVDTAGFEKAMERQREMARTAHKGSGDKATEEIWFAMKDLNRTTEFLGYDVDEADGKIIGIVRDGHPILGANAGDEVFIILDKTPFYGESGGQVGDVGIFLRDGKKIADILDTKKPLEDFIVHKAKLVADISIDEIVYAAIDTTQRNATRANHSATHLLHKALRDKLGEHVSQKGSLVDPNKLRFDFSHTKAVAREEIAEIERKVNEVVARNTPVDCKVSTPDEAIKAGAMALFGEKYGDKVRVLSMGIDNGQTYSVELCGGTHVRATGDIGLFKVTSEGSVASGIRRIEAVTGEGVRGYFIETLSKLNEQLQKLSEDNAALSSQLKLDSRLRGNDTIFDVASFKSAALKDLSALYEKTSAALQSAIQSITDENKKLNKELAEAKKQAALGAGGDVTVEKIGGINFIGKVFRGLDPKELRPIAEQYRKQADVVALGTDVEGKASMLVASSRGDSASLVQAAVAELGGKGGGGRPEMAQGGGPEGDKLESAIGKIRALL